jgi:hypothetical protein
MSQENIVKISISEYREIHVQINTFKGRTELDIRTHVKSPSYTGYSQKGVRVPIPKGKDIAQAIETVLSRHIGQG